MRLPRLSFPGIAQHIVLRGNNRESIFRTDHDYRTCLLYLEQAADKYGCLVHAYVLMPNHMHLLVTPSDRSGVGRMVQLLARQYVQYFNQRHDRTGTLWEGRYKSALVDGNNYALDCYCYIEKNPQRNGLSESPADYPWSSYRCNAMGASDSLVTPCEAYVALGNDDNERQQRYQLLTQSSQDFSILKEIRQQTHRSRVVGDSHFKREIELLLGVDLTVKPRGGDRRSQAYQQSAQCAG